MDIKSKVVNLKKYIIDMSKYHLQNFIEMRGKFGINRNYVLMFHCILEDMSSAEDEEYSISTSGFKQLIEQLSAYKFHFCDVKNFVNDADKSKILLTFDDAYSGVYTELFSFLKSKQIPFVVFQTCVFLDAQGYLSTGMINEMLKYDKFTLGTHTISHCNLHESVESKAEILEPINFFKRKFGVVPEIFAYPYGAFVTIDLKNIKLVKDNYRCAFSTCCTCCGRMRGIKRYVIPRININESNYKVFLEKVKK